MWSLKAVIALCGVCSVVGAALHENIDIDIKVDSDSKLYHQGKTVEGSFNYGYNVPRRNYNQYQHKVKGPDGVTYGCYGFVDPTNGTHLYHYVSDLKGYRVVPPNHPTKVFTERVANSVADVYDSVGVTYDWEKLYFPDVCRVLQKSKEERNELSIPKGYQVNDDGSVTQTTQKPKASEPPRTASPSAAPKKPPTRASPPSTTSRPAPARTTPPRTTQRAPTRRVTAAPETPKPTTARPTTARPTTAAPRTAPPSKETTPRATTAPSRPSNPPRAQKPATTRTPVPPAQTTQARTAPKSSVKPRNNFPESTPKPSGNKYGTNRDNFVGAPATNTAETLKPPQDLEAVGQDISELKLLLQMLLKSLNNAPKAAAPAADCDDDSGLGAVNPNAKQVFLPLVIVDRLPGAKSAASPAGVPAGSQFAIPSIGYGSPRCNTCG